MKLSKETVLLNLYLGASVVVLAFASIGLWHWYWESSMWASDARKEFHAEQRNGEEDKFELIEPPKPVVCFPWADDSAKKGYPIHWGPEPEMQTKDYRKLPEPFGHGSSTLFNWIEKNQANDAKNK